MKKRIFSIMLVMAMLIAAVPLAASFASDGYNLIATGDVGTEDRITVDLPDGVTLSQLQSISWQEWLVAGYPPHVDIRLDLDGDGAYTSGVDDVLVIEYAYNTPTHCGEGQITGDTSYGALAGAWYDTFADDGNGPAVINGDEIAWLASQAPGPYTGDQEVDKGNNFWWGTIDEWKAGTITGLPESKVIDGDSDVLYLEIEVDNWIIDTTAMIKEIVVDFSGATATLSTVVADEPAVVNIVLDINDIDFGTVYRGVLSGVQVVRVTNGGNVPLSVVTAVTVGETSPFNHMTVTPSTFDIPVGGYVDVELQLDVPADFALGDYTDVGGLNFTATATE